MGRIYDTGEHSSLNIYAKYFHVHTGADSWTLDTGDFYEVDGMNSDRIRVGGRVLTNKGEAYQYYYGAGYEYEFNGDVHMRVRGDNVDADSLRGGTGFAELGVNYKKDADSHWSFDLNAKRYVGKREGISAQLQVNYDF